MSSKVKQANFRLPLEYMALIDDFARREDITKATVITRALDCMQASYDSGHGGMPVTGGSSAGGASDAELEDLRAKLKKAEERATDAERALQSAEDRLRDAQRQRDEAENRARNAETMLSRRLHCARCQAGSHARRRSVRLQAKKWGTMIRLVPLPTKMQRFHHAMRSLPIATDRLLTFAAN
ncbi:MAG: hypothetical protein ACLTW2_02790 [Eggerthellaceae bacterium]